MPKKDVFEMPYMKRKMEKEEKKEAALDAAEVAIHGKKRAAERTKKGEFEDVLEERMAEAQREAAKHAKKPPREKTEKEKNAEIEKLKKMRREIGFTKMTKEEEEEAGWDEALKEAEKRLEEGPSAETEEALGELRRAEREKIKKQKERPSQKSAEEEKPSAETRKALKDLRAAEKGKIKEQEEKMRREISEEEETEKDKSSEQKGDKTMAEYLKHAISSHPELLSPEIKKNVDIITKQEAIITKNEDNAKKNAQEKVKIAKEIIKKTQPSVNDYIKDVIEDYKQSAADLNGVREEYENAQNELLTEKYGNYDVTKGSITRFFKDRKLKKKLSGADYEEFEKLKMAYDDAFSRYDQLLKKHTKKYGRLEDALESGPARSVYIRGKSEKLGRGM